MAVDATRLLSRLEQLSHIGRTPTGGVTRLGLSRENAAAKELVARWMREAGLTTRYDAAANLMGRLEGGRRAVILASHLDSVIEGGRFDGPLGVVTALEAAQLLVPIQGHLAHSIEVVVFSDEEGTRFGTGFFGSRAMLGKLPPQIVDREDADGVSIAQAMAQLGYDSRQIGQAVRDPEEIAAYLEVHIEQGAVLDELAFPVGVVTGIAGPVHLQLTLRGRADHAGATPMNLRRDPLTAAAQVIVAAEKLAREISPTAVATVGQIRTKPGAVNVIPGLVEFSLDVRDVDRDDRNQLIASILEQLETACLAREVEWAVEERLRVDPVPLSPRIQAILAEACEKAGVPVHRLPSGAGHDAMVFAPVVETGMLFVRSRNGISHSPQEWTDEADVVAGAEVLYHAVLELAVRASAV